MVGDGQAMQVRLFRYIVMVFVGQDTLFVCPINQFGFEWQGHVSLNSGQSDEYNGV